MSASPPSSSTTRILCWFGVNYANSNTEFEQAKIVASKAEQTIASYKSKYSSSDYKQYVQEIHAGGALRQHAKSEYSGTNGRDGADGQNGRRGADVGDDGDDGKSMLG
jgi:hypothetical protein